LAEVIKQKKFNRRR